MSEVQSDVMSLKNPGKKYTGKYTFVKGSTYAFSVSVKEIQTIPPVETKYANVSLGATENGTIIYQAGKVEVNSTVTFKVTPDQYYKVDTVSYTLDGGDPQVLVADDNGDYSFLAAKENGEYLINATFVLDEANLPYTKISALNTAIDGISSYTGYLEASYVTRGYVTGWTDVNTNYNSRTNVYIADGENAIVLYSVPTDKLADIQIGDLVQVNAVASSVGKYSSTKQIIFNKDGATNTITEVDSDATVAVPSSIVLNDETQASVSFDTTAGQARRVEISNAVFKNIGGHSNHYAYFTVNTVEYSIYLTQADNACYDEIVSLAEGNKFTCTAFVGQFSGDLQFIGVTDLVVDYDNPVSVAFDETVGETLNVGSSVKLSATVSPATAKQSVTYSIIDGKDFASLDADGATLTGTSAGTVTVRATVNQDVYVDKEITIKAAAATVLLKSYSYLAEDAAIPEWTGWGREIKTAADIVTNILYTVDGAQTDDFITAGNTTPSKVYANEDTANKVTPGIRMGTGSLNGSFSINTASPVVKIVLKVVPHNKNGNSFNIYNSSDSGAAAVNVAMDKSNTTSVQELTFEFSAASTYFKFESIQRCAIFGINFYGLAS